MKVKSRLFFLLSGLCLQGLVNGRVSRLKIAESIVKNLMEELVTEPRNFCTTPIYISTLLSVHVISDLPTEVEIYALQYYLMGAISAA